MLALFKDYWELALLLITWLGIASIELRRWVDWRRQRYSGQVGFSLNLLEELDDGETVLRLRTLFEDSASRVWINEYGVREVQRAAARTSAEQPFLEFESPEKADLILRAVTNVLSERFADAFIARALGADPVTADFVFGITWERYGVEHTERLRVMIARRQVLERVGSMEPDSISLEKASHRPRILTLSKMHELSQRPDRGGFALGVVELGVVGIESH